MEHKLVRGGEQFLPFARSRVKALRATGLKYASQQFEIDGFSVKVRIAGDHDYLSLSGGTPGYQFFTTGHLITSGMAPGTDLPVYRGYATRVDRKGGASPAGSSLEGPPPTKAWKFVTPPADITQVFPRKAIWQIQGIPEYTFHRKGANGLDMYPRMVTSWSSSDQLHTLGFLGGGPNNRSGIDVAYDAAPSLFAKKTSESPLGAHGLAPDADWYKRAAFRTVESAQYGSRTFIILTDISNVFHVFPAGPADETLLDAATAAYPSQAIKTNVPAAVVQALPAPLPAWCRTPTVVARDFYHPDGSNFRQYVRAVPQYRWAFNSSATRACCIVYEDLPGLALNDPAATKPFQVDGGQHTIQEALPGLAELSIDIVLTGPNPEDFSFALTLVQALRPTATKQYVMAADYAWDVVDESEPEGSAARYFARIDDLVLMFGELYHTSALRVSPDMRLDINAYKARAIVRNMAQGRDVRTFLLSDTNRLYAAGSISGFPVWLPAEQPHKLAKTLILAMDLRVLAFVVQQRYSEGTVVWQGGLPRTEPVYTSVQRVKTLMGNVVVDEIIMDPGTPLDAALVAAFADTGVAGLHRYAPDDVGLYPAWITADNQGGRSVYASFDILASQLSSYQNTSTEMLAHGGDFQAGAYFYGTQVASALQLTPKEIFAVSPDGSWSIATTPIFHYSGAAKSTSGLEADGTQTAFDPALVRQAMVDIICFKSLAAGGAARELRTSHLAAFNRAYGKALSPSDFACTFTLVRDEFFWNDYQDGSYDPYGANETVFTYLKAATPAGAALWFLLGSYSRVRAGSTVAAKSTSQVISLADLRYPFESAYTRRPEILAVSGNAVADGAGARHVDITTSNAEHGLLSDLAAVLNGSTLFY